MRSHIDLPRFFLLCSLAVCTAGLLPVAAQVPQPQIVTQIGEATVPIAHITPEQARAQAIRSAKEEALRKAVGEEVLTSETVLSNTDRQQLSAFSSIESRGGVTAVELLEDSPVTLAGGILCHRVRLRATVQRYTTNSDPAFDLKVAGLNPIGYRSGEPLAFELTPTDSCYLHLFLFNDAGEGTELYPNAYEPERLFERGRTTTFPTNPAIQYTLELGRPLAREETNILVIIQTRRRSAYTLDKTDFESVSEWVSRLEPDQRHVTTLPVRIVAL